MSWKAVKWVFDTSMPELNASERWVLTVLADHYNEEWSRAWPGVAKIARLTHLSDSTVKRSIRGLESSGLVVVEQWMLNDGALFMPNRYLLPAYRPGVKPAREQPVLAFALEDSEGLGYEDLMRVDGSNLFVEADALAP